MITPLPEEIGQARAAMVKAFDETNIKKVLNEWGVALYYGLEVKED